MAEQGLLIVVLLVSLLVFGLIGYRRGKGISSCCASTRKLKRSARKG